MAWTIEFDATDATELQRFDRPVQRRIIPFLRERIAPSDDPRAHGKALRDDRGEFWLYRIGDYRLPCRIEDDTLVVLVVTISHRRDVYRRIASALLWPRYTPAATLYSRERR